MEIQNNLKILITAGGGGHFSPALSVIKKLHGRAEVLFVGRKYALEGDSALSFEYHTVHDLHIPFETITAGRLARHVSLRSFISLIKIPIGFVQSFVLLRNVKPDVVLSFGGYIALPITLAAWILHIPIVIHEQTMRAGLANRIAGKFAAKICLTFPASASYFPKEKTVLTGNPLRDSFGKEGSTAALFTEKLPIIYITGGSLGSHAINLLIAGSLERLLLSYCIIHQTGDAQEFKDFEMLSSLRDALPGSLQKRYQLQKFVPQDEIFRILTQSSLVISRAGMSTIMELIYCQKPALLIPLPHGQKNEQNENAEYMASLGLAVVKKQEQLTPETLYTEIEEIMARLDSFTLHERQAPIFKEHAAEEIIATVFSVSQELRPRAEEKTQK